MSLIADALTVSGDSPGGNSIVEIVLNSECIYDQEISGDYHVKWYAVKGDANGGRYLQINTSSDKWEQYTNPASVEEHFNVYIALFNGEKMLYITHADSPITYYAYYVLRRMEDDDDLISSQTTYRYGLEYISPSYGTGEYAITVQLSLPRFSHYIWYDMDGNPTEGDYPPSVVKWECIVPTDKIFAEDYFSNLSEKELVSELKKLYMHFKNL